ncbi:alpha/beta fold hydrolase [Pseudonocardia acidicola]|uniref:Alpha/beta hydrolase n=1 Tax=Pseudonocardia acidicola TaxID=2724939 RepID=A0ABX1SDY1_9PSEU|nr:alpha/beta hydrolase [Pseudonocardia acidicola]
MLGRARPGAGGPRAAAVARLQPQSLSSCRQPLRAAAWETIPATYVVADSDPGLPPVVQEGMTTGRADRVAHIDAGHSPFLSRPRELAAMIAECEEVTAAPQPRNGRT